MEEYQTIEVKTSKRDNAGFGWLTQIRNEQAQLKEYIAKKLGANFKVVAIYPHKRKKFVCPHNCGNTYVWLSEKYLQGDFQILQATCACCNEIFLILQKRSNQTKKAVRVSDSFNNNSGSINFKA